MTDNDNYKLDLIMDNKTRYSIRVNNDAVWIQDNELSDEDEDYWVGFDEYGYEFIASIFKYLGFDSDFV